MVDPTYDALLHLMDRQVIDSEGQLVAKVDDLELRQDDDGALVVSALLIGMPALLPRFDGRLGRSLLGLHLDLRWAAADRGRPLYVGFELVEEVTSEVRLGEPGRHLLDRLPADRDDDPHHWRLNDLLGRPVHCPHLPRPSKVLDVRVAGRPHGEWEQRLAALVVGPGRPGALLGYDRRADPGPWPVADLVRWLHRHARLVPLGPGVDVDLGAGEVRLGEGADPRPLLG